MAKQIKKVAVIGGGPAGIASMKCLKEEDIIPICYERTSHMGGLWRYHDDDDEGLASVMKTTIINSSKEMTAISDFPPKEDAPNYMHNRFVHQYLLDYANKHELKKHVIFNKEVIEISLAEDYYTTGRLKVAVKDTKTGETSKDTFDGVMVCVGHHVYPNLPSFPGMNEFQGKTLHTHSLKVVDEFKDQVVVVVGAGNSGMDASVEISSVANQVYLSSRRGAWVYPRVGPRGLPLDVVLTRRWLHFLFQNLPYRFNCWFVQKMLNERFDHETYKLKPKHGVLSQHPTVSDTIPIKLLSGTVKVRKNIRKFVANGVIFDNEDAVTECDSVVFATGYRIRFPFLSDELTAVSPKNEVHLYKYVFPPHLKHPTLAIIGLIQSLGGGFPVGEAQTRWATLVLKGKCSLPSKAEMEQEIYKAKEENKIRFTDSQRHTIQVDYITYLDEITALFGAKPNMWKIFFTDPQLFHAMVFGPSLPYQYRLQGPHPWKGARKAILEWDKRVIKPLNSEYESKMLDLVALAKKFVAIVIVIIAVVCYFCFA